MNQTDVRMAGISVATKEPWYTSPRIRLTLPRSVDISLSYYRTHDVGITDHDRGGDERGFTTFAR